jgi:hypothetical protein
MDLRKDRLDPSRDNPAAVRRPAMPKLVAEITYLTWTADNLLRQNPADGLAGSVARARTPSAGAGVTLLARSSSCEELIQGPFEIGRDGRGANSNSGNENLRPETLGVARREGSPGRVNPTAETVSPRTAYGNVALFPTRGNHLDLRGLPGGGRSPAKPVQGHRKARQEGAVGGRDCADRDHRPPTATRRSAR